MRRSSFHTHRFTHPLIAIAAASFAVLPLAPRPAVAQEVPPAVENSKNSAIGQINADAVYVRSGAGDNYYPTVKLNTGAQVTVVGVKFDWLKILPPEGSYCYIAKAFVEKTGESAGTVNRDAVNVRAGSTLNAMKTTVAAQLASGQPVKILGEQDEYYKIVPPPDAFVYVKKDLVSFVKAQPQVAAAAGSAAPAGTPTEPVPPTGATPTGETATQPIAPVGADALAGAPSTQPTGDAQVAAAPSTQPTASVEGEFDKLEADFTAASAKPIEQQPVTELLTGYQKLVANPQLPESMRRIADFRTQVLKARVDTREQFAAVQKQLDETKKRQQAMKAEAQEIDQQIKKTDVIVYAAVGTLRTSSLQQGAQVLYRLTDPASGRTVCYIRSDDPKYGGFIGQFIGVKGEVNTDPQLMLKVVKATDAAVVDPNQVYRGVAPLIVPPSMVPSAGAPQQASATEK